MKPQGPKAVILLSGGIDSTTSLAIAISQGYIPYCLSFSYGQRHKIELDAAARIAAAFKAAEHCILPIGLGQIGGSALTDNSTVPKNRSFHEIENGTVPITYVPARNTIFLAFALAWAEVLEAEAIFIGVTAIDYSGYPDCRPEFIAAFQTLANLATKTGVTGKTDLKIKTPLIEMSKADIIKKGVELGVDYSLTLSCYDPDSRGVSCGSCDSCLHRKKGFAEAGIADPTLYVHHT